MSCESLKNEEWESLLEGLARGEYHLLLGAGASIGACGGDGRPLPNARTLTEELLMDFGFQAHGEDIGLQGAYEAIESRKNAEGYDRTQYLKLRFSNCQPTWHSVLPRIYWKRVWTLNIDNVIEQTYTQTAVAQKSPCEGNRVIMGK